MNKEILSAFIEKNLIEASFYMELKVFPRMFSHININTAQDFKICIKSY